MVGIYRDGTDHFEPNFAINIMPGPRPHLVLSARPTSLRFKPSLLLEISAPSQHHTETSFQQYRGGNLVAASSMKAISTLRLGIIISGISLGMATGFCISAVGLCRTTVTIHSAFAPQHTPDLD